MKMKNVLAGLGLAAVLGAAGVARADVVLWVNDVNNNIGKVDITTQSGTFVGNAGTSFGQTLTDIGFTSNGNLYGVSFDNTYSINTSTGHATFIADNPGTVNMNAHVGYSATGLYGAANDTTKIYSFNTSTNTWSTLGGNSTGGSAGDLALDNGVYYESVVNGGVDQLVKLTISGGVVSSSTIGTFSTNGFNSFNDVFGLAFDGTTMYAVNGTTIYSVNLGNARLTSLYNYSGDICTGSRFNQTCLGSANGSAFLNEASVGGAVPEPATWGLMIVGIGLMGSQLRLRRRAAGAVA